MAITADTPVPTPDSWVLARDLRKGDIVFDDLGAPMVIEATQEYTPDVCYRVGFRDGTTFKGDGKASLGLATRKYRIKQCEYRARPIKPYRKRFRMQLATLTLAELAERPLKDKNGRLEYAVPMAAPQYPWRDLPVPPYVFGVWWGSKAKARIPKGTKDVQNIRAKFRQYGYEVVESRKHFEIRPSIPHAFLFAGADIPNSLPFAYCQSSIEQRQQLLEGFIDAQATNQNVDRKQLSFHTPNWYNARRFQALVESLGYRTSLNQAAKYEVNFRIRSQQHHLLCQIEKIPPELCVFVQTPRRMMVGEGFIPVC